MPGRPSGFLYIFRETCEAATLCLATRLLDVTSNALAALFFACREKERTNGEVLVFDIPADDVKYYNSGTVSVISNVARRPYPVDLVLFRHSKMSSMNLPKSE